MTDGYKGDWTARRLIKFTETILNGLGSGFLPHTVFFCTFDRNCNLVCIPFGILFGIPTYYNMEKFSDNTGGKSK